MARQVPHEGRENRGWVLIAESKADDLARTITTRRVTVASLLQKAIVPESFTGNEAARRYAHEVLTDITKRFTAYPDVADLVGAAQTMLDAEAALESLNKP